MEFISYVNTRSSREADDFSSEYVLVSDYGDLLEIASEYKLEKVPTSALILMGEGEYAEIWVTFSRTPYWNDTIYNRITRYMRHERKEYAKYAVSSGQYGCIPNTVDVYVNKKNAMEAFFEELERSIDAGYECGSIPSKRAVSRELSNGNCIVEFDRNEYVMIEKYDPF